MPGFFKSGGISQSMIELPRGTVTLSVVNPFTGECIDDAMTYHVGKFKDDDKGNKFIHLVDEGGNDFFISIKKKDVKAISSIFSSNENVTRDAIESTKIDDLLFYFPSKNGDEMLWLCTLSSIVMSDQEKTVLFDWNYYNVDKKQAIDKINDLVNCEQMQRLETAIKQAATNPGAMKQLRSLEATMSEGVLDPSIDKRERAKKIFGFRDFGKHVMRENKTGYIVTLRSGSGTMDAIAGMLARDEAR